LSGAAVPNTGRPLHLLLSGSALSLVAKALNTYCPLADICLLLAMGESIAHDVAHPRVEAAE